MKVEYGKILSILKQTFEVVENRYYEFDGVIIETEGAVVRFGIGNEQDCCEEWGFFSSNDDESEFIGAEVRELVVTDTALNSRVIEKVGELDSGGIMFVNIETDRGTLQYTAYNAHNGYYGHTAILLVGDKKIAEEQL